MYVFSAILIGFVSAFLAGMFGIGGAGVNTLALRVLLRTSPGLALGTTLPVTIPTAMAGALTYYRRGLVDLNLALFCSLGGVFGSIGGAWLTKVLNLHYLMLATGGLAFYFAGQTIYRGATGRLISAEEGEKSQAVEVESEPVQPPPPVFLLLGVGLAGGFLSGLLGVGGGIVLIPAFIYLLHIPIKKAFGTSLAVITVIAIPGTIVHALLGHISGWLFLYLVIGVVPGAYLGARVSIRTGEKTLYILFGSLLMVFGVIFIVNEIISMT